MSVTTAARAAVSAWTLSLHEALRSRSQLSVTIHTAAPQPHEDLDQSGSLTVEVDDGADLASLARVLETWLETNPEPLAVQVAAPDGTAAVVSGGQAGTISELIKPLTQPQTRPPARPAAAPNPVEPSSFWASAGSLAHFSDDGGDIPNIVEADEIPVTIYLSDGRIHKEVETAVGDLLAEVGLEITHRDNARRGSWFRQMRAGVRKAAGSRVAQDTAAMAAHAVETRTVLAQDAAYTAMLLQNLGPVLTSLQPTKDAVLRVGAVLIVKVDWAVTVYQLTPAQQLKLDHEVQLARSPHEVVAALGIQAVQQAQPPAIT
ncbi:MAG TPA: hypothetical protein VGS97_05130 [Actinocrinis sp.]|uniref:effector-associated constant component EACC1 n=1 Tax=Actinocrinis sp. TaxID=1920516 RepID=UPI002DDD88D5|nr:hypothetical protein [Actinocrinis sp.]HEV2343456.1 hypothetical protein [Actinocrinis sp.]